MAIIKNKVTNFWEVRTYYKDFTGKLRQKTKRGFKKKSDAAEWERQFKLKGNYDLNMTFGKFLELYEEDVKPKLKYNTWLTKEHLIRTKIEPYFKNRKISEITPADVIKWQNQIRKLKNKEGEAYSPVYLKTIHNQLSAILNHAVNFYNLKDNAARKAGNMGKEKNKEMLFWTKEEYQKFIVEVADKPMSYYSFEILYWCAIRCGELLALTKSDFNFENNTLRINKSYQRLEGKDYITEPKTAKSNRIITMPDFLAKELKDYIDMLYGYKDDDRIFPISKTYLHHEMDRGTKASGVKRIRIHDIRHSAISNYIDMGFSAVAIGERVGHESVDITYRYAHLFPTVQKDLADQLDKMKEEMDDVGESDGQ